VVHFVWVMKSGPFCGGTKKWSILCWLPDKSDCQIKKAFVFPHSQNGWCTCAVIAVGCTGYNTELGRCSAVSERRAALVSASYCR
jgi:hypothetical protein